MKGIIGYDRDGRAIRPGNLCLVVHSRTERQPPPEWLGVLGVAIKYWSPGRLVGPRVLLRSPLFVEAEGEVIVWCSALQRITGAPDCVVALAEMDASHDRLSTDANNPCSFKRGRGACHRHHQTMVNNGLQSDNAAFPLHIPQKTG